MRTRHTRRLLKYGCTETITSGERCVPTESKNGTSPGDASDYDKFLAYAKTLPDAIGNPLYHWSHLELKRYFGIDEVLNEKTAPAIWEKVNAS